MNDLLSPSDKNYVNRRELTPALKALTSSSNVSAVESQEKLFHERQTIPGDDLSNLMHNLVATHRYDVIELMLQSAFSTKNDNDTRMILMYEIKKEGINSFDDKTQALLEPYLTEIRDSGPVGISD